MYSGDGVTGFIDQRRHRTDDEIDEEEDEESEEGRSISTLSAVHWYLAGRSAKGMVLSPQRWRAFGTEAKAAKLLFRAKGLCPAAPDPGNALQ